MAEIILPLLTTPVGMGHADGRAETAGLEHPCPLARQVKDFFLQTPQLTSGWILFPDALLSWRLTDLTPQFVWGPDPAPQDPT